MSDSRASTPLLQIIRQKCRWCCCDQLAEIRNCRVVSCPLHPYRMGQNPFSRRKGNPQSLPNRSRGRGRKDTSKCHSIRGGGVAATILFNLTFLIGRVSATYAPRTRMLEGSPTGAAYRYNTPLR
jgi:hypothetical protein